MPSKGPGYRIGCSHFIMFTLLTYIFVTLGLTLSEERHANFLEDRKAFDVIAVCFFIPLLLSLMLLYGIYKDKLILVRTWLLSIIPITVLLLFLLLSGAVYVAIRLKIYWGILLCAMPFVLTLWMSEGIIVMFSYYKKYEASIKKENPV